MPLAEAHPADAELQAFALGTLSDGSSASIEAHLACCPTCEERVTQTSAQVACDAARGLQHAHEHGLIRVIEGHYGYVGALSISADGKTMITGSGDSSLLAWDLQTVVTPPKLPEQVLTPDELEKLWMDLAADDAPRAHQAIWTLAGSSRQRWYATGIQIV